ncbi:MAG: hypothetical protein JWR86_1762 [Enterovirga sp.]|nr:hypothetical protein [Enterovirga sp.]
MPAARQVGPERVMAAHNLLLLAAELLLYFSVLALLFRLRKRLGIGLFVTALGTVHFLEGYLAALVYVGTPGGFVVSPGSSVLFAGKLVMLLLLYVKEDATAVRQPIYGLLAGNLVVLALVLLLRLHGPTAATGRAPDIGFLGEMGWLMAWGSVLLYLDCLALVLVYEKLGRALGRHLTIRIWLASAVVLTFDQLAFFAGLVLLFGAGPEVLLGGWIGKMVSGLCFALLAGLYLRFAERDGDTHVPGAPLADVFGALTYRERYHALVESSGRDALTGALNRNRLEQDGRHVVDLALTAGQNVTVAVVDVDRFKSINDRFGHALGDEALRRIADAIRGAIRPGDYLFRYGGDEFLVCAIGLSPEEGSTQAERLRAATCSVAVPGMQDGLSSTVGIATGPADGSDYRALFALADARLLSGKTISRFRAWSGDPANTDGPDPGIRNNLMSA